ncbi:MAG: putative peptide maturation dehydrogenase [Dokdonella sp.]
MRIRRCAVVMIESRERLGFDPGLLPQGGTGIRSTIEWVALAPHLDGESELTPADLVVLGEVSPTLWLSLESLVELHSLEAVEELLRKGLLVGEGTDVDKRDRVLRSVHWRPAAAVMHYGSRWQGVDTEDVTNRFVDSFEGELLDRLGPPPAPVLERVDAAERLALPRPTATPFDQLLGRRVTCRNFDPSQKLTTAQFSSVMYRAFGARVVNEHVPGFRVLKKAVPSAGALHPTEAYVLVQRVDGIAPGLFHYHPVDHALEPIQTMSVEEAVMLANRLVASQGYFSDAHAMVFPTSRFQRQSWKYRNHAKAYRALILDIGHISQTLYLAATELGLGAFITAAINEVDIEEAFGLDSLEEAPLAVCGFGVRAATCEEMEFDPLNMVWPASIE